MIEGTTKEQRNSLRMKWEQASGGKTYREFIDTVAHTFGCDGAVTVHWCGMWLCIERDGYTHT